MEAAQASAKATPESPETLQKMEAVVLQGGAAAPAGGRGESQKWPHLCTYTRGGRNGIAKCGPFLAGTLEVVLRKHCLRIIFNLCYIYFNAPI